MLLRLPAKHIYSLTIYSTLPILHIIIIYPALAYSIRRLCKCQITCQHCPGNLNLVASIYNIRTEYGGLLTQVRT